MLSHGNDLDRSRACNDNGPVSVLVGATGPTLGGILAAARGGRGLTLTYVADGVLIIDARHGAHERRRGHEAAFRVGVKRSA